MPTEPVRIDPWSFLGLKKTPPAPSADGDAKATAAVESSSVNGQSAATTVADAASEATNGPAKTQHVDDVTQANAAADKEDNAASGRVRNEDIIQELNQYYKQAAAQRLRTGGGGGFSDVSSSSDSEELQLRRGVEAQYERLLQGAMDRSSPADRGDDVMVGLCGNEPTLPLLASGGDQAAASRLSNGQLWSDSLSSEGEFGVRIIVYHTAEF